ncbi:hypothetical protein Hanom_Chr08g00755341 [Helianthus anomalus]
MEINSPAVNDDVVQGGDVFEDIEGVQGGEDAGVVAPVPEDNSGGQIHAADAEENILETPSMVEKISENNSEAVNDELEGFIPGNLFNFENNNEAINDVDNIDLGNVINKRKKKATLVDLGRPNPACSSSLERTKVGKKAKCVDDPFGLDDMLGLGNEKDIGVNSAQSLSNSLDLNTSPILNKCVTSSSSVSPEQSLTDEMEGSLNEETPTS